MPVLLGQCFYINILWRYLSLLRNTWNVNFFGSWNYDWYSWQLSNSLVYPTWTSHRRKILAYGYHAGSVLFIDRVVHQQYLVKNQFDLFRLWFIAIYNGTHMSLAEAHLHLFSNILSIHTFLITLEYQINCGGRGGLAISTHLISRERDGKSRNWSVSNEMLKKWKN